MGHNKNLVVMGTTRKSFRVVDNELGVIEAGKIVRMKSSDESLSLLKADGEALGISCGKMLGRSDRTNIVRSGLQVPLLLTAAFQPAKGTQVHISDTTGLGVAAGAGATGMNAVYASDRMDALKEDGSTVVNGVALIDMQGGL